ncbi:MAG: SWIM zinc finger family protein [Elainellaceae cyanobacterium]
MPQSRTWWGQEFIGAIEHLTDSGRLSRGRSYSSDRRIKYIEMDEGFVQAHIRGNINSYFGIYEEPTYITTVEFEPISRAKWTAAIALMASKAGTISRLLLGEIPDNIEASFTTIGLHLLPASRQDFTTSCSCPDFSNPCKHIAGVFYYIAAQLDQDPFLLFELRGLPREELKAELAKTPLGQALSTDAGTKRAPEAVEHYYTRPKAVPAEELSLKAFWQGEKPLPQTVEPVSPSAVPAILVKKQGDFPAFWHRSNSFIAAMEGLYQYVRSKNQKKLRGVPLVQVVQTHQVNFADLVER